MESITVWAAFGGGVASFLSPCILPLVPVYLAILAGPEILENPGTRRRQLILHSISFVLGFAVIYTLMGALVGLAGVIISPYSATVRWGSGILLIVFGVFMLAALKFPWLNFEKRLSPNLGRTTGYLRSLLIGAVFTLALTPCTGYILGGVLTLAASSSTAWQGAGLLAVYSLGLGLPFILMGAFFGFLSPFLKKAGRFSRWIYAASGVLLIAIGVLIITGKLGLISAWAIAS